MAICHALNVNISQQIRVERHEYSLKFLSSIARRLMRYL